MQLYTAVGDRKSELRIFFPTFYVKFGVSAPYYAVLLFKLDLTQNMAYLLTTQSDVYSILCYMIVQKCDRYIYRGFKKFKVVVI